MKMNVPATAFIWSVVFALSLLLGGCSAQKHGATLTSFVQQGQQSLVELTDIEQRAFKIDTVETPTSAVSFVINSTGKIILTVGVFVDKSNRRKALVIVDSAEKEDALGVLDRRFLSSVANQSEAYKKWFDKHAVFAYGTAERTESFEVSGGLGTSTVHSNGATIVGMIKDAQCHCYQMGLACVGLASPLIACVNKFCDLVNCTIGIINGSGSSCSQEGADAKQTCELAVGQPQ